MHPYIEKQKAQIILFTVKHQQNAFVIFLQIHQDLFINSDIGTSRDLFTPKHGK